MALLIRVLAFEVREIFFFIRLALLQAFIPMNFTFWVLVNAFTMGLMASFVVLQVVQATSLELA